MKKNSIITFYPHHEWGDEDFDWKALYEAQGYIYRFVKRWSRVSNPSKEKYGTLRYMCWFVPGCSIRLGFHILSPFKRKSKFSKSGYTRNIIFQWCNCSLTRVWTRYAVYLTKVAVHRAAKKWPQVHDEILWDIQYI